MVRHRFTVSSILLALWAGFLIAAGVEGQGPEKTGTGLAVDKKSKTVTVSCTVAPRKLPNLKQIYPLEVVATYPAPKGQKAHETVVVFDAKPSEVHKALESLGLKAGQPGVGERSKASGPEVRLFLEVPGKEKIPVEEAMVDMKTGKTLPRLTWLFTGSAMKNPDPEKDDKVYGADLTGTLITIFPVTDDVVIQTNLAAKDEGKWKLEINSKALPKEGSTVRLVIQVP
jgi:hypothetical protein